MHIVFAMGLSSDEFQVGYALANALQLALQVPLTTKVSRVVRGESAHFLLSMTVAPP